VRMSFGPTSHEEKAQGAGTLTFHIGPDAAPWRVFGAKETGTIEVTLMPKTGAAVISAAVLEPVAAVPGTAEPGTHGFLWKSEVPEDCPFEPSKTLTGVFFTGRHSDYRCGDTGKKGSVC